MLLFIGEMLAKRVDPFRLRHEQEKRRAIEIVVEVGRDPRTAASASSPGAHDAGRPALPLGRKVLHQGPDELFEVPGLRHGGEPPARENEGAADGAKEREPESREYRDVHMFMDIMREGSDERRVRIVLDYPEH